MDLKVKIKTVLEYQSVISWFLGRYEWSTCSNTTFRIGGSSSNSDTFAVISHLLTFRQITICSKHGLVATALNCDIVLSEFELQSRYHFYFLSNTIAKGMNPFTKLARD